MKTNDSDPRSAELKGKRFFFLVIPQKRNARKMNQQYAYLRLLSIVFFSFFFYR